MELVICLLLSIATFALYSPAVKHPFIFEWDDACYVVKNSHVQVGLKWNMVTWALTSNRCGNWHPVTWLSHALDCALFGLHSSGHHVTSILLHLLNVMLLFLLLNRATGAIGRSAVVSSLFAVHPFNVESVVWIAERKNVLSTLFFLLSLAAYGWYARNPSMKRYGALVACFLLGLASKPMVITLPCVLLLLDFWPLRRSPGWDWLSHQRLNLVTDTHVGSLVQVSGEPALLAGQVRISRLILEKLPLFVIAAASAMITVFAQRSHNFLQVGMSLPVRMENAIYSYAMYVWKAFWPVRLAAFYPHPWETLASWRIGVAAFFLLAVSVLVWRQRGPRPYLLTGWSWFLVTLVPVIGIVQVGLQAMADRYAYIPLMGIFVMAAWGVADLSEGCQLRFQFRTVAVTTVLVVLALLTSRQIGYWRSSYDLWTRTLQVTKDNSTGNEMMAAALLASGRTVGALPYLQEATRIRPLNPTDRLSLDGALAASGNIPAAIAEYEAARPLASDPGMLLLIYENLGRLYGQAGNYSKARASYQQALQIDPQEVAARDGLAKAEVENALRKRR
jgi:hypothetical protein